MVNVLTGDNASTAPWLASHMDVNAIDLTGAAGDAERSAALEEAADGALWVPARQVRVAATVAVQWVGADVPVVEPPARPTGNSCLDR